MDDFFQATPYRFASGVDEEEEEEEKKSETSRRNQRKSDPEEQEEAAAVQIVMVHRLSFDDQSVRAGFIRKVFALVTLMFAVTAGFSSVPIISKDFAEWCHEYWWLTYVSMAVYFVFYLTLVCCQSIRRCFPCNLIVLTVFTLSAATMTMFITAHYSVESVMIALLITTLCSASIIVFAATTSKDLTSCLGIAFILGMCLIMFGLMTIIFVVVLQWYFLNIVYSALGALLCMFYLAIDVQMIMGGRRVEISPEEYIFAATHVFVDILTMFFHILGVVGRN
ncbi:unnamed protein product [Caenorhabditis sp. 36 PRJEB53466]|nr:unnamed protein product [Caenorhabditis sp. 36 PRJEB53466]